MNHLGVHSRLWLLFFCTLLAAPLAVGTLHFPPPGAFGEICHVTTLLRPEFLFIIFIAYLMWHYSTPTTFFLANLTLLYSLQGCLIAYYFLAETWFAVLFTVIVEIVPPEIRWLERLKANICFSFAFVLIIYKNICLDQRLLLSSFSWWTWLGATFQWLSHLWEHTSMITGD